ncbi:MAG TPA: sensor histidine kinase [Jiangellaceae bacterium]|nr:sensor histidine kinase [Jiangellaceae bacterium]
MSGSIALPRPGRWLFDVTLTVVLLVSGIVALFVYTDDTGVVYRDGDGLGVLLVVAGTAPLVVRRRNAATVALLTAAAAVLLTVWDYGAPIAVVTMLIGAYSAGAYASFASAMAALAGLVAAAIGSLTITQIRFPDAVGVDLSAAVFSTLGFVGVWGIGRAVRGRRFYTSQLEDRADRLERTRAAEVRAALAEERARIARELHDVVAHHVAVMTVQAGGARRTLRRDPDGSIEAMEQIESTGRIALAEMRRIVGVLREPGTPSVTPAAVRTPQPGLGDLDDLVHKLQDAGLPVDVRVEGQAVGLPVGVDLTAFRVVQEALTNTLKHAGPTRAVVTLNYSPDELVVQVADEGHGLAAALGGDRQGHGLLGMRERVALYGGSLHVGPRDGGGFEVRAHLPYDQVAV